MGEMPKLLVFSGLFLAGAGAVLWLLQAKSGWFGHLPGDIRIERSDFRFYFPITTMALLSLMASLALWIVNRFRR